LRRGNYKFMSLPKTMRTIVKPLFTLLSCFLFHYAVASVPVDSDSTIRPTGARLSQQEFLDRYGTDDTSRALIRYYFSRNKTFKRSTIISGGVGLLSLVVFDSVVAKGEPSRGGALAALGMGIVLLSVIFVSAFVVLFGIGMWLIFSRRSLFKQLQKHKAGGPLPKRVRRNPVFQTYLKEESNR
jgi:hypothetical protein